MPAIGTNINIYPVLILFYISYDRVSNSEVVSALHSSWENQSSTLLIDFALGWHLPSQFVIKINHTTLHETPLGC